MLLQLDKTELRLEAEQAGIDMDQAQTNCERSQALHRQELVSQDALETGRTEHENAKVALERAMLQLENAGIQLPIASVVMERLVEQGDLVSTNEPTGQSKPHFGFLAKEAERVEQRGQARASAESTRHSRFAQETRPPGTQSRTESPPSPGTATTEAAEEVLSVRPSRKALNRERGPQSIAEQPFQCIPVMGRGRCGA